MKKTFFALLFLAGAALGQISSLSLPHIIDSAAIPQVSYVDDNDAALKNQINVIIDTVNALKAGTGAFTGLTASRLMSTNASKQPASVSDLTSWIAGTANQITSTSDGDGSLTLSLPSAVTLPGSLSVTTTLGVTGLQTNAADIAMSAGDAFVRGTTSDGSDSHRSILSGGGASSTSNTRGSSVITKGNEYASQPGGIDLVLGGVTGSAVRVIGGGAVVDSFSAGGGLYVGGTLSVTSSASGSSVNADVENSSNTASSNARLHAQVAGTSAGDPFTHYSISGTQEWATGPDNSDGDAYVITPGATPGVTTNGLRISTAGAVTVPGTLEVTSTVTADSIISSKFYTEATFTLTGTGFTSSPTGTARYVRVGKMVTLYIPSIQATSNAATLTYTGVPAAIRPARIQTVPVEALVDNSSNFCSGYIDVETGGTLTVARRTSATATNPSGFTTSNTKGISGATITYTLQ